MEKWRVRDRVWRGENRENGEREREAKGFVHLVLLSVMVGFGVFHMNDLFKRKGHMHWRLFVLFDESQH